MKYQGVRVVDHAPDNFLRLQNLVDIFITDLHHVSRPDNIRNTKNKGKSKKETHVNSPKVKITLHKNHLSK
jgi:hypothetical protein